MVYERYYFLWLLLMLFGAGVAFVLFPAITFIEWGLPYAAAVEIGALFLGLFAILAWR